MPLSSVRLLAVMGLTQPRARGRVMGAAKPKGAGVKGGSV